MAILQIILSAILVSWVAADDSCPAKEEIAPCTCDGEGVNCMRIKSIDEVKRAFRANYKYGGVRGVWVQGTPITSVPKDLFANVKSQQFYIELNAITSIDFQAFSASKKTLRTLSLFGNQCDKLSYSDLSQYERLDTLNLGRNQITSIPASALSSKSLRNVILTQNKISSIGPNAFSNLPNLIKLELSYNKLTTLGPMSLASNSHPMGLQIFLIQNQISNISSTAFEGTSPAALVLAQNRLTSLPSGSFANLVIRIGQIRGFIDVSQNPLSCTGCDYSWIVTNQNVLEGMLRGFTCTDGKSIRDLTTSDIQCSP